MVWYLEVPGIMVTCADGIEARFFYALFILQYTVYTVHCTVYNVQCTLHNKYCTLYNVNVHCTMYIVQCTLHNVHCILYNIQCIVYVVHAWWYVGSIDEVRRIYKNHEYIGIGVKPRGTIRPPVCVMVAGGGGGARYYMCEIFN